MTTPNLQTFTLKNLRRVLHKHNKIGRGFTTVPDGHELADIELVVDLEALARRIGIRAMRSKAGKSSMAYGLIKARVTRRERTT